MAPPPQLGLVLTDVVQAFWGLHFASGGAFLLIIQDLYVPDRFLSAPSAHEVWIFSALSILFAVLGRVARGVTIGGAVAGAALCFALLLGARLGGFTALLALFVLTWAATRIGYGCKQMRGTAEAQGGRSAAQVFANVGVAAMCAVLYAVNRDLRFLVALGASLSEAAADTVSSEIGQAVGVVPRLVTTWSKVAPGTDGAITLAGTLAGVLAAMCVSLTCVLAGIYGKAQFLVSVGAALLGMLADSFLGATLERRGALGNNGVNFLSTAVSAVAALLSC